MTTAQWAAVVGVALTFYLIDCRIWPYRICPRCHGTGRRWSYISRGYGDCRRCGGDGQAVRWGRRITAAITRGLR